MSRWPRKPQGLCVVPAWATVSPQPSKRVASVTVRSGPMSPTREPSSSNRVNAAAAVPSRMASRLPSRSSRLRTVVVPPGAALLISAAVRGGARVGVGVGGASCEPRQAGGCPTAIDIPAVAMASKPTMIADRQACPRSRW